MKHIKDRDLMFRAKVKRSILKKWKDPGEHCIDFNYIMRDNLLIEKGQIQYGIWKLFCTKYIAMHLCPLGGQDVPLWYGDGFIMGLGLTRIQNLAKYNPCSCVYWGTKRVIIRVKERNNVCSKIYIANMQFCPARGREAWLRQRLMAS